MTEKEEIVLDAVLLDMISFQASRAELENGHPFIAHGAPSPGDEWQSGDRVEVMFSPFDMSKARILKRAEVEQ